MVLTPNDLLYGHNNTMLDHESPCGKARGSMTKNIGPLTSPLSRNDATRVLLINFILGKN